MRCISLIGQDIKRLRALKSLEGDLAVRFTADKNTFLEFGDLPACLQRIGQYSVHKVRLTITNPRRQGKRGCRLWVLVHKEKEVYIQCLLYAVEEEPAYKSSICFKVINERLKEWESTAEPPEPTPF